MVNILLGRATRPRTTQPLCLRGRIRNSTSMLRLGLIGCGEHSEGGHAIPLARYKSEHPGEIELSAACNIKLESTQLFCREYGFVTAYCDMQEMIAQEKLD